MPVARDRAMELFAEEHLEQTGTFKYIPLVDLAISFWSRKFAPILATTNEEDLQIALKWAKICPESYVVELTSPWIVFKGLFLVNHVWHHAVPRVQALVKLAQAEYPDLVLDICGFAGVEPKVIEEPHILSLAEARKLHPNFWNILEVIKESKGDGSVNRLSSHARWCGDGYYLAQPNSMRIREDHIL